MRIKLHYDINKYVLEEFPQEVQLECMLSSLRHFRKADIRGHKNGIELVLGSNKRVYNMTFSLREMYKLKFAGMVYLGVAFNNTEVKDRSPVMLNEISTMVETLRGWEGV